MIPSREKVSFKFLIDTITMAIEIHRKKNTLNAI